MSIATTLSPAAIAKRHALTAQFRRAVAERYHVTLFPHQAEWQLATEGWVLTDLPPIEGQASTTVCVPKDQRPANSTMLRSYQVGGNDVCDIARLILPRPSGIAHHAADLAAYKAGKSFGLAHWASGFAIHPNARVQFIGLEYGTSEPEFNYLLEFLLSDRGMGMKYAVMQNDKRGGRMRLKLAHGAQYEVRSWNQKESLKGDQVDAYIYCECYQLPGLECYTSVAQNLRQRQGFATFGTTADRPWVSILHEMGHGKDPDWHCTCGVHGRVNPFTYDAKAEARDDPERGGLMTRERYAIAWQGLLGSYVGRVYDYQRGQKQFTPTSHPELFDWRTLYAQGFAEQPYPPRGERLS